MLVFWPVGLPDRRDRAQTVSPACSVLGTWTLSVISPSLSGFRSSNVRLGSSTPLIWKQFANRSRSVQSAGSQVIVKSMVLPARMVEPPGGTEVMASDPAGLPLNAPEHALSALAVGVITNCSWNMAMDATTSRAHARPREAVRSLLIRSTLLAGEGPAPRPTAGGTSRRHHHS